MSTSDVYEMDSVLMSGVDEAPKIKPQNTWREDSGEEDVSEEEISAGSSEKRGGGLSVPIDIGGGRSVASTTMDDSGEPEGALSTSPLSSRPVAGGDLLEMVGSQSLRFFSRMSFFVTGCCWWLLGAAVTLCLTATLDPPRYFDCASPGAAAGCDSEAVLPASDCSSPYLFRRPGLSVISSFDLKNAGCATPSPLSPGLPSDTAWLQSAFFVGGAVGGLFVAPMCDKIGRRPILTLGILLFFLGSIASTAATTSVIYGASRLVVGLGVTVAAAASYVLLSELTPPAFRRYLPLVQAVACVSAGLVTAGLSAVVPSWRVITLLTALPALWFLTGFVCLTGVYLESPKWLAANGKMSEAFSGWLKVAKINRVTLDDFLDLDSFIKSELETVHNVKLATKEELDEELALMSLQHLASPDTRARALRTFPTSVWIRTLALLWTVAAAAYLGLAPHTAQLARDVARGAPAAEIGDGVAAAGAADDSVNGGGVASDKALSAYGSPFSIGGSPAGSAGGASAAGVGSGGATPSGSSAAGALATTGPGPAGPGAGVYGPGAGSYGPGAGVYGPGAGVSGPGAGSYGAAPSAPAAGAGAGGAGLIPVGGAAMPPAGPPAWGPAGRGRVDVGGPGVGRGHLRRLVDEPLGRGRLSAPEASGAGEGEAALSSAGDALFASPATSALAGAALNRAGTEAEAAPATTLGSGEEGGTWNNMWNLESRLAFLQYLREVEKYLDLLNMTGRAQELYGKSGLNSTIEEFSNSLNTGSLLDHQTDKTYWEDMHLQAALIAIFSLVELPIYLLTPLLVEIVGRKKFVIGAFLIGGGSVLVSGIVSTATGLAVSPIAVVVNAAIGRCLIGAVLITLFLYTAELTPTTLRCGILGVMMACASTAFILAQPLAAFFDRSNPAGAFLCFGALTVLISLLPINLLPETQGKRFSDSLDTLELNYKNSGYDEAFFGNRLHRVIGYLGRYTCCLGRFVARRLGIADAVAMDRMDFEQRGRAWLKQKLARVHIKGHRRRPRRSKFIPLSKGPEDPAAARTGPARRYSAGSSGNPFAEDAATMVL